MNTDSLHRRTESADGAPARSRASFASRANSHGRRATLVAATVVAVVGALWAPGVAGAQECPNAGLRAGSSALLPDCRAYEMVSPPDKAGGSVGVVLGRTKAAVDGSAITFISMTSFGNAFGTGVESEYMAQRTGMPGTPGWSTHGLIPKQDPVPAPAIGAFAINYAAPNSPDLSTGIFRTLSPLTDAPDVANVFNLYLRRDMRTPVNGTYSLVTGCPACAGTPLVAPLAEASRPMVADASSDFGQVLFESKLNLTGDGSGVTKAYLSDNGAVRLIGKVPPPGESACGGSGPACVVPAENGGASIAGLGAHAKFLTPNVISDDGTRVNFTAPASPANWALVTDESDLYQADSRGTASTADDTTVQVNASERTVPDSPSFAKYQTASVDGSRVFFTTLEDLTDDTPADGHEHLYMWERDRPVGERLTLIDRDEVPSDVPGGVEGMIGASDDGSYVYFVANSRLVPDAAPMSLIERGIYVWHEGTIRFIGNFTADATRSDWTDNVLDGNNRGSEWNFLRSRVAPDGKAMMFAATNGAGLGGFDHNATGCGHGKDTGCIGFYVYHAEGHELMCATCNPSGARPTSDIIWRISTAAEGAARGGYVNRQLSHDGRRVFFTSAEALAAGDVNGRYDAYQFDSVTGEISLLSSGKSTFDSYFLDASGSGDDVFFATRERLVGWDVDETWDLYDARVGGGFAEPIAPPVPCGGSACQGPPGGPPALVGGASEAIGGAGNVRRPSRAKQRKVKRCRSGFARKRVRGKRRCVRKNGRAHRRALRNRGQRSGK